jgi:hypothetical protein
MLSVELCRACEWGRQEFYAWRHREWGRFETGEYAPLPWENENWFYGSRYHNQHIAHVSLKNPGLLAYTQSSKKGQADIQTPIKPGRYLTKYFGDVLTFDEITSWSRVFNETFCDVELKFAVEADDIEEVYLKGPRSCMKGCDSVRAYAAGDLAIAYIENCRGEISARTVCWPAKKIFGPRLYGDEFRLRGRLMREGYTWASAGCSQYEGARLTLIRDESAIAAPYWDGGEKATIEGGAYLVLREDGEFALDGQHGLIGDDDPCERCGNATGEDYITVDDEPFCTYCASEYANYCEGCSETTRRDGTIVVITGGNCGGEGWLCERCCESNGVFSCDHCGESYQQDYRLCTDEGNKELCLACAENHSWTCAICDEIFYAEDKREVREGSDCIGVCVSCHVADTSPCSVCQTEFVNSDLFYGDCDDCVENAKEEEQAS